MLKKLLLFFLLVFVVAQFIRPTKNTTSLPQPDDIFEHHPAPQDIKIAIRQACYDCHSNNTRYPWYAQIQPLGWWLASHVKEGKDHLNFSEFGRYSSKRAARELEEASEQVGLDAMPLPSYTLVHSDARFSPEQKRRIEEWFDTTQEQVEAALDKD